MPPRPLEKYKQHEFTLRLRAAIDTARKYPTKLNREEAIELARSQPHALQSAHARHNLGVRRLAWLRSHGVEEVNQ